ncbi:Putative zinc-finger [Thermoanaerobacter thermohydrosulfuricus]|uniref:Anti-sigma-W factor RsiW n=3 Tax=Thermoanaerobacter TaxID=1754 RepID=D3T504_THEIA|nr:MULTISPECIES: DUF2275 domain-containing protein [Thermoanaerobacter]ADD03297.1 putative transmembrane anti-sigma factor [Thermoanaerobacter italicus Ab9]EMT38923.1 putative integral membrane protein (DUF2275) [Thermoanaerobacter thermohydrosulfuricus WC1]SDG36403.1 Putative zinc-finger [Thermoanaerobacter thermohydrosulfuricus]SFE10441.1 Putative zinc-finger [Thermoanaerobacter thermohydrosulfuricus]
MCYDEGTLQAYLDSELDEITAKNVEEHLKTCDVCREKLEQLKSINEFTSKALKASNIDLNEAWATLNEKLSKNNNKGGMFAMFTKYKKAIAALVVVAFVVSSMLFPPLKNAEAKILNLLRLNKMQIITITPDDITQIQNEFYNRNIKNIDLKEYGEILRSGSYEGYEVSINEIDKLKSDVDYKFKLPTDENFEINHIYVSKGDGLEFKLNVDKINELIKTFGGTHLFPKELNNKPITINVGTSINIDIKEKKDNNDTENIKKSIYLTINKTPEIVVPEGANIDKVIDALANLPFLPDNLKKQIASVTDWKETLPIPMDESTNVKEINIRGNTAIILTNKYSPNMASIAWNENGVMYSLSIYGPYEPSTDKQTINDELITQQNINTLIQIANSMR